MLLIFLLITLIIYIIIVIAIKVKLKFWSKQPVFHVYNIFYWLFPPGIINHRLPEKNKYINFNDITFSEFNKLSKKELDGFVCLVQKFYLNEKNYLYFPEKKNIIPYFTNHFDIPFISLYYKNKTEILKNTIQNKRDIIGAITGRPLNVLINNNKFLTYYIDYLCVDNNYRKQGIAPQLIQTYEYIQRRQNKQISTCLFKREGNLTLIVPLVIYYTYAFNISNWKLNKSLHSSISLIKISEDNINLLINFLSIKKKDFPCYITSSLGNILDLIKTNNIIIYGLIQNNELLSVYFFRDSTMTYNSTLKAIDCYCTINNCLDLFVFALGFSMALKILRKTYSILLMENLGHSNEIIKNIIINHPPYFLSKTAYYFYNFAIRPFNASQVCIIN